MPKDPVCGTDINEEDARSTTGQTMHGASEVGPPAGHPHFPRRLLVLLLRSGLPQQVSGQPQHLSGAIGNLGHWLSRICWGLNI